MQYRLINAAGDVEILFFTSKVSSKVDHRYYGRKIMSEINKREILELMKLEGNDKCADCGKKGERVALTLHY